MKFLLAVIVLILGVLHENINGNATNPPELSRPGNGPDEENSWITMKYNCIQKMQKQINMELEAAMTYMAMGAHFSRDTVNRPGFAKFFFESSSEEREHAIKLMQYLTMRGEWRDTINLALDIKIKEKKEWGTVSEALNEALGLEAKVTRSIRGIIGECEKEFNDYHLVDYLTGEFLEEQYHGQRQLAGMISTLDKMVSHNKGLGEFLYDKKVLNGEI